MENTNSRTYKAIVACAIIFVVALALAIAFNVAHSAKLDAQIRAAQQENERLQNAIELAEQEIKYLSSPDYAESYARRYLGMKQKGEIIFVEE